MTGASGDPRPGPDGPGRAPADVASRIEAIYRAEFGRIVAALTQRFGDLGTAEEMTQDAFAEAVRAAGGSVDAPMRLIAAPMQAALGQPVVIENRAGAAGSIGAAAVAQAPPDGYTILGDASSQAANPALMQGLAFDYATAFAPVTQLTAGPSMLVVRADGGPATLAALDPRRPAIVLSHNPDSLDLPIWGALTGWVLAGHTHGGQCRPPFLPPPILPVRNRRYTAGPFDVAPGRTLYVNRGLGHMIPVR